MCCVRRAWHVVVVCKIPQRRITFISLYNTTEGWFALVCIVEDSARNASARYDMFVGFRGQYVGWIILHLTAGTLFMDGKMKKQSSTRGCCNNLHTLPVK